MEQVLQSLQSLSHGLVRAPPLDIGYKGHTASIMFIGRVIQSGRLRITKRATLFRIVSLLIQSVPQSSKTPGVSYRR